MAKRSRKRVHRRPAKKSWFDKFFTFPKLALYLFVFLSVFTTYQVTRPTGAVLGVTDDDIKFVTKTEQNAIIQEAAAKKQAPPTFHQITVFKDGNENGKHGLYEDCLAKIVTFTIYNGNITRERTRWGCDDPIIVYTKSRTVTVGLKVVSGYRFTGLTYIDQYHPNPGYTLLNGAHSVKVTGFPSGYPSKAYYTVIDFGVKPK